MQRYGYRLLLLFLRSLVYVKRAVLWIFAHLALCAGFVGSWYRRTFGFRIYKYLFSLTKRLGLIRISPSGKIIDILSRRGSLQVILFFIGVVVMIPHSKLYTRDSQTVVGRETLLYSLVGPGPLALEIEEVTSDVTATFDIETPAWREGVVRPEQAPLGKDAYQPQDITSLVAGGGAITKPTLISGNTLPVPEGAAERTEVVLYTVEPGDVIGAIAAKYGVSVETILWANNLTARSYIRPGDTLKILPMSGLTHTVKKGDTVGKIAKLYDASEADIVRVNRLQEDGADIIIGEDLIVPGGEKPEPAYVPPVRRKPSFSSIAAPPPSVSAPAGSGYVWPAGVRYISQYFGLKHDGVDIAGPKGTPLYAAKAGTVSVSKCGWNGGYGCYIILDHGEGVQTVYGHASELLVTVGEEVTQGQTIALMGSTGNSSGPHVHFEVRVNRKRQNPLQYIR